MDIKPVALCCALAAIGSASLAHAATVSEQITDSVTQADEEPGTEAVEDADLNRRTPGVYMEEEETPPAGAIGGSVVDAMPTPVNGQITDDAQEDATTMKTPGVYIQGEDEHLVDGPVDTTHPATEDAVPTQVNPQITDATEGDEVDLNLVNESNDQDASGITVFHKPGVSDPD